LTEPKPAAYYEALYAFYDQGGAEKVIGWLQQRDITNFKPHAPPPMTDAKRDMIDATMPKPVQYFRDLIRAKFGGRTVLMVPELRRSAEHDRNAPKNVSDKYAAMALKAEGFNNGCCESSCAVAGFRARKERARQIETKNKRQRPLVERMIPVPTSVGSDSQTGGTGRSRPRRPAPLVEPGAVFAHLLALRCRRVALAG
jgi:hypothetical protein